MTTRKKQILIINTGGTISCIPTATGLQPTKDYLHAMLSVCSTLKHTDLPAYHLHELEVIDSSNMTVEIWNQIAQLIQTHYDQMDGFIILHGTDTMAYTASALSFMLENLTKPVILTGSQLPLSDVRTDGIENLVTALLLCAEETIREVCIYFGRFLLRGNRARKFYTNQLYAFSSPNLPPLATIDLSIRLNDALLLPPPALPFHVQMLETHPLLPFRFFPGFCPKTLKTILTLPLRALILETYGTGNAYTQDPQLLAQLKRASENGLVIINTTQCPIGAVEMSYYSTGQALQRVGVISAKDMTPEAIHAKLLYALTKTKDANQVRDIMETALRGEM